MRRETQIDRQARINEQIRVSEVRVIDEKGRQLGVMPVVDALEKAKRRGLDLVEVAPQADPVVVKILDYGKYKYEQEKRRKRQRKKQSRLKEMRFTTKISDHDFNTKLRHIRRFLEDQHRVRITVIFRGREIVHMDRGQDLLNRIVEETQDIAKVIQSPQRRGRTLQMLLVSEN
ncbi:MAG: translation initiation factor IF-3 [Candidatus Bipolaricaulia bacterium]